MRVFSILFLLLVFFAGNAFSQIEDSPLNLITLYGPAILFLILGLILIFRFIIKYILNFSDDQSISEAEEEIKELKRRLKGLDKEFIQLGNITKPEYISIGANVQEKIGQLENKIKRMKARK